MASWAMSFHLLLPGEHAISVGRSADEALRRITTPACQAVLTDFSDASGRTLQSVLDALGQSPGDYLAALRFAPGDDHPSCRGPRATTAFTTPGSRVIFVCGRRFTRVFGSKRVNGALLIIHEMLHSLGLGEDPPTSREITDRVRLRCGA